MILPLIERFTFDSGYFVGFIVFFVVFYIFCFADFLLFYIYLSYLRCSVGRTHFGRTNLYTLLTTCNLILFQLAEIKVKYLVNDSIQPINPNQLALTQL